MNFAPSIIQQGGGLALYEKACQALAQAKSIDEVKDVRDKAEAMRAYARQSRNRQLEIDASEIRFRAERRLGELMQEQRESVGLNAGARGLGTQVRVDTKPTLAEVGIDKNLADRARKYAAIPAQKFEGILSERRERIEQENERVGASLLDEANKHVRGTLGTGENEWYTPRECIRLVHEVMGAIDLDPASAEIAQQHVMAGTFFTEEVNGLEQKWFGRVFLNPPYSQPAISQFSYKMVSEWEAGNVSEAIMLTHNYTDTAWFQKLALVASAICFTRGRIKFVSPEGEVAAPTQGQAYFYFGTNLSAFHTVFSAAGFVVEVRK